MLPRCLLAPLATLFGLTAQQDTDAIGRADAIHAHRIRTNCCPKCNYDRTGLAQGAVCPECGSAGVST